MYFISTYILMNASVDFPARFVIPRDSLPGEKALSK